jgi:hypothetical protein
VLVDLSGRQVGLLTGLQIWRDLFLDVSLAFVVVHDGAGGRGEVVLLEVVDMPFFSDFVDGRRRILVEDSTGTSPGRRATATCASLVAADLFIDSQSLVGDGAFLDLAKVEARRLFLRSSRRRWNWTAAAGYGGCRKP